MILRKRGSDEPVKPPKPAVVPPSRQSTVHEAIPGPLEIAGQWGWRILAIAGVLFVLGMVIFQLREIVVPFMVAILLSALLVPLVNLLIRNRWPRGLAVAIAMLGTIGIIAGLIVLIVTQVRSGLPGLQERTLSAYEDFKDFLAASPLQINEQEFDSYINSAIETFQSDGGAIWSGALSVGTTAGHLLAGTLLVLFSTLFILIDGKNIWAWVTRLFPRAARPGINGAGISGWLTLTTFVKVQIFVAAVDAVGIGLGAWIVGLVFGGGNGFPLLIPITIAVFLGSFIPIVGAVVTGVLAVLVALIYLGPVPALIMLGVVLLVQQVEGHVLQPLIIGSAVKVHPLAVVFAVAAGAGIAGIPGALFAVPVIAVINVMVTYIANGSWRTNPRPEVEDVVSPA